MSEPELTTDTSETILEEAIRLTQKERQAVYGPPEVDFERSAELLNTLFAHMLKEGQCFLPADIARIQICIKLSRSIQKGMRDNWVDLAGYAACGYRCETGEW